MNYFTYPWWAKIYTVWMSLLAGAALLVLDLLWIKSEHPEGYIWILLIIIVQYFFTEFRAQYWSISIMDDGLVFRDGERQHPLHWNEIESIKEFPTIEYQPAQWPEGIFSSGIIVKTKKDKEYVIYKKINDYSAIVSKLHENT